MFGLGLLEIVMLLVIGLVVMAVAAGLIFFVVQLARQQGNGRTAELEAEVRELRRQLDEMRDRTSRAAAQGGSDVRT